MGTLFLHLLLFLTAFRFSLFYMTASVTVAHLNVCAVLSLIFEKNSLWLKRKTFNKFLHLFRAVTFKGYVNLNTARRHLSRLDLLVHDCTGMRLRMITLFVNRSLFVNPF